MGIQKVNSEYIGLGIGGVWSVSCIATRSAAYLKGCVWLLVSITSSSTKLSLGGQKKQHSPFALLRFQICQFLVGNY